MSRRPPDHPSPGKVVKSKDVLAIMNVPGLRRSQVQTRIQRWRRETGQDSVPVARAQRQANKNNNNNNASTSTSNHTASTAVSAFSSSSTSFDHALLPPVLQPMEQLLPPLLPPTVKRKRSVPDEDAEPKERTLVQSTVVARRRTSASTTTTVATTSVTAVQHFQQQQQQQLQSQRFGLWSELDELPIETAAHARLFEPAPHEFDPFLIANFNSDLGHSGDRHRSPSSSPRQTPTLRAAAADECPASQASAPND